MFPINIIHEIMTSRVISSWQGARWTWGHAHIQKLGQTQMSRTCPLCAALFLSENTLEERVSSSLDTLKSGEADEVNDFDHGVYPATIFI